ncbi:MAG: HU family DNA-binding protein [Acidobacteriota bacterium]|nr:HU family DNA-binding protein [Acidobacteriota bacterium]
MAGHAELAVGSVRQQEEVMARVKRLTAAMTKSQIMADISENTGLSKRDVASVFAAMETVIERHIKKGSVGYCTVPGLMKIKTVKKPAQKAKKNVPNPFRPGELMDRKAKPASRRVKILALKKLKDMA